MSALSRSPGSFFFVAAKAGGGRALGFRQAISERALADLLRRERLLLLRSYRLPAWASVGEQGSLKLKDSAELNDQLAQLLSRGVPLVEALEVVSNSVRPGARSTVERMRELVAAGSSFSDACHRTGAFDRVTIAVYRAAERTGDLADPARQLAMNCRRQLAVRSKVATLMIYPLVVLSVSVLVAIFMLTTVVPSIGRAMASFDAELPWYSALVMNVGQGIVTHAMWVSLGAGVIAVFGILAREPIGRLLLKGMRRTPRIREVILAQESARFFSIMAAMTRSGVPLADALGVANEAVGLPKLRRQLETLRNRLVEGGVLRSLIEDVTMLPMSTRKLLIAAERAGDMETAFDSLASDMTDEVDRRAIRLLSVLEPMLIVLMFLIIFAIVLALLLPLLTLSNRVL